MRFFIKRFDNIPDDFDIKVIDESTNNRENTYFKGNLYFNRYQKKFRLNSQFKYVGGKTTSRGFLCLDNFLCFYDNNKKIDMNIG